MTHSLRSDLWWTIPFRIYLVIFGIPFGSLTIKLALARHTGVQRVSGSRQSDHVINFFRPKPMPIIIGTFISNLQVYMGCALAIVFQVRSLYVPIKNMSPSRGHFWEYLVFKITLGQIHLSIEAQCDHHTQYIITLLPNTYINQYLYFTLVLRLSREYV